MNLVEFLKDLSHQNVELWVEGEKLRYRAPKEALTTTLLNQIKQHKTKIIDLLKKDFDSYKFFPLSYGQQGLWFLYKLAPHSAAYNIAFTVRIRSHLNIPALQRAVQKLVTRHPALRTTFGQRDGEPFQQVHQYREVLIEKIDAFNWDDSELRDNAIAAYQRPFDLETGDVIRVNLFTRSPEEYVFILTIHHIAVDGFSFGILLDELRLLYEAENTGSEVSLAAVNYSYKDFVQWQNQMLKSPVVDDLWAYWHQKFAGELPVLNMPTDRPRPPIQNYQGACYHFELSKELTDKLREIGRSQGATLYTTMLAAFQVLLHRYTGQEDIVVGSPTEGRSKAEFANTVGFFVNMLAMRVNVAGLSSFAQLLSQVRQTVLAALTHQDYPSTLLIEQLRLNRDPSLLGLFRASFNLLKLEEMVPEYGLSVSDKTRAIENWGGLKLEPFVIPQQEGQNDLILDIVETKESLIGIFRYNTDLFDQTTIERMVGNLQALLEGIVSNPQQKIALLPMLSEVEHNLLRDWNRNQVEYSQDLCIHQLFEDRVNKTPNAIAVSFKDEKLTYQELNFRANQLARYLQTLGVKPEVLVGICVERSLDMVVGLLGILKAGGAYVPYYGGLPQERLNFMLADSQVSVLLTQQKLLEILPQQNVPVVCLDKDWEVISQESSQTNLVNSATPENLAYIIYTSGSTGKSKGVAIAHQSLINAYWNWEDAYQLHSLTSHLQMANFSFDVFSGDLIRALCSGGKLVLCPREWLLEPDKLYNLMREEKIDCAEFVPPVLRNLVQYLETSNQNLHFMGLLAVGSDSLYVKEYQEWKRFCDSNTRLINSYGLTEATIDSTYFESTNVKLSIDGLVPIGRPFNNTQVYILDNHLQPVPIGVSGELYIGGVALARGYLNRPELTKQKFIPNPFERRLKQELLYKTGDLARYLPDGNISFIGRIDNQVKIRGFRIELGEIEAVLKCHPQIQEAVVITGENVGTKCLVAYVVLDESLTIQKVREFIKQKLPDYMIPSAFVTLDTLPLSSNGKIDRKALPTADADIVERDTEYIAPRTHSEEIIANIFAQVLNVESIGIHDNFFELGGHSLLATQLISRVRSAFSIEIPLRELFSSPTVAQLDHTLTQLGHTNNVLTIPPIQPRTGINQLPLSFAQERLWFLYQLEGKSPIYNMPAALRISGNLDINALQQAFFKIVQRHEVLGTSFQTENGTPIQVIHPDATININLVDLQQLETTESETLVLTQAQEEATTPFDLENAPLIRCSLLQLSTSEYVLLLTMHHIISDGWSMGVFIQELSSLYQAFLWGEDISSGDATRKPLAELPIQYADFAIWQRQYLSGEVLSTQLDYWKQQLHGVPDLLQLPTDYPRPTVQTYQGSTRRFSLNTNLTTKLQKLSRSCGATLFITLYAAFSTLLYRYSGQSDILIGSPIANRNRSEIEGLIGFFVNTLVLRTRFEDNPSFKKLLAQVRETTLKAYEHQDVPFEQLVEALQPKRSLSHSPLFQVMFVLQNALMGDVELPGVSLSPIQLESTIAKFDLTLSITETEQGLLGEWEYNTDLFNGETIERMVVHFQNLLEAIVENPSQKVGTFNLLSESERNQLLVEWNDTTTDYPKDKCIHQLFEEQVEKTPDAIAVVFESEELTYRQLNQRANQLAHHLQTLGVGPEVLVGICVERSIEMVVGLLGTLKAGGAYVPLDSNYPQERLSYMLEDSGVGVLVTQSSLLESLPELNAQVICLDSDWGAIEQQSKQNLDTGVGEDNLAYVIYTSGSTGKPKGVAIEHHSVCNLAQAQINVFDVTATSNVLQFASFSFDASVSEIFMALTRGARLILGTASQLMPGDDLNKNLRDCSITHVTLPPSALAVLPTEELPQLTNIIVAGEVCPLQLVNKWSVGRHLFNAYGPTESTVCATATQINPGSEKITIGHPIANTQIYILDSHLQPVPIGVPGELYIGGDGLARGYLNQPELTSEKFISSPFDKSKLYKTGDLARYLPDGDIEFLGRIDNQVKIRGFRIELGEIEAVLASHPQVNQAVVIALEENTGNKRLVAYCVTNEEIKTQQLREFLKGKLPDYMVPSAFVTLESFPLTPNGKIDRKALPEPSSIKPEHEYVEPRTPIEFKLSQIWSSILNISPVGVQDNFFELGGHSLLAVRLMSEIQQQFHKNLPLAALFQNPTIEKLAIVLRTESSPRENNILVPIQPEGSLPPLFCVPGADGQVFNFYHLGRHLGTNQPFYGLQAQALDGETLPLDSIEEIATANIQAIQTVQEFGPYFLVGYSFGAHVVFEMAIQLQRMGESVAYVGILDVAAPTSEAARYQNDCSHWDDARWICEMAPGIEEILGENLLLNYETLTSLSAEQQVNYFKQQLERVGFLPPQTDNKLVSGLLQVFRTRCQIQYVPHHTSTTNITLFRAADINFADINEEIKSSHLFQDPAWGWNQFCDREVKICTVPGNHLSMLNEPHVKLFAEKLQKSLEQARNINTKN